jgi:hypothetical protein
MFYHRLQKFMILVLLTLHAAAESFAATIVYAQTMGGLIYKSTDSAKTSKAVGITPSSDAAGAGSALTVDTQNSSNLYWFSVTAGIRSISVPQSFATVEFP